MLSLTDIVKKGGGFLHFKDNKEEIKRRTAFAVLIVFTAVLQNTGGLFPKIFGAGAMLLVPLTVCIAMFENDVGGMMFGLLSGVIWDFYSPYTDGFYAIILIAAGYAGSFLIARYMRNNVVTATVYCAVASFLCATLYFLIFILSKSGEGAGRAYLRFYLVSVIYTVLLTPLYYFFVRMIAVKFMKEDTEAEDERL